MTKKLKQKIYFTLAIVLILGMAFAYFHSTRVVGGQAENGEQVQTFVPLIQREEHEVKRIVFRTADSYSYMEQVLNRDGALQWSYSPGQDFLLNIHRTRDKARQAWALTAQGLLHEDLSGLRLSEFGLEPPLVTMEITYTDYTSHTVQIGGFTHDLRQRFMMFDDNPHIYLLSAVTAARILSEVDSLIDMSLPLLTFESALYYSVWQDGHGLFEFLVPLDRWWEAELNPPAWVTEMTAPFPGFLPNIMSIENNITEPLMAFRLLEIRALAPESLEEFGLDEPWLLFEHQTLEEGIVLMFGNTFTEDEIKYVYVKIASRPHVFVALYDAIQSLVDINPDNHIIRTLSLVNILDIYALTVATEDETFYMVINHYPDDNRVIHPTINGIEVEATPFRTVYQYIIGIAADASVPEFLPPGAPYISVHFHHFGQNDRSIWFFERDSQFYYMSVDGGNVRFVTNRRAVDAMVRSIRGLIE